MFIVGTGYQVTFGNDQDAEYKYGYVKSYNHPLILFLDSHSRKEVIYNLGSSYFLKAEVWNG